MSNQRYEIEYEPKSKEWYVVDNEQPTMFGGEVIAVCTVKESAEIIVGALNDSKSEKYRESLCRVERLVFGDLRIPTSVRERIQRIIIVGAGITNPKEGVTND